MSAKTVFSAALAASLALLGAASAQAPDRGYERPPPSAGANAAPTPNGTPAGSVAHEEHALSPWIVYHGDSCWGSMNGAPIFSDLYLRTGANFPVGGDIMGRLLTTGWSIGGGARALLFNPTLDRAWTIDAGITNTYNRGNRPDVVIPLNIIENGVREPAKLVTLRDYNRTTVNLAFGREIYLWGAVDSACCGDPNWRIGWDVGGRYGSAKADFNEIRHRTDVIGGVAVAVHTDFEIPCGCCIFYTGVRLEWGYTWGDILQQTSDVQDVSLLVNLGVRF